MRLRLIGLLGLLALVVASCGATPPQASGPNEGIQVHGDWTIDIYNVDGSHDEHIAFSNDLYPSGATALRDILARSLVPVNWAVWARGEPTSGNPCLAGTNPTVCVMEEATGDLQVSTDGASLVLDGAFTAERDGNVGSSAPTWAHARRTRVSSRTPCTSPERRLPTKTVCRSMSTRVRPSRSTSRSRSLEAKESDQGTHR